MTSLTERLKKNKTKTTKKQSSVEAQVDVSTFVIAESDIQKNTVYQIATDPSKSLKDRVDEVIALRAHNSELTTEENAANLKAVKETLIYFENSIMNAAMEANQFTHDDALSLFDDTVRTLQGRLISYKDYINPFVKALDVLGRAREAGMATSELLQEAQDLKDKGVELRGDRNDKIHAIGLVKALIDPVQQQANDLFAELKALEARAKDGNQAVQDSLSLINQENEGAFSFVTKDRNKVKQAQLTIENSRNELNRIKTSQEAMAEQSKISAATLVRLTGEQEALQAEIGLLDSEIESADSALLEDEDMAAISRLLEITGDAFKEERTKITDLVTDISRDSVADLEKTAARFKAGHDELRTVSAKVTNITDFNRVIFEASEAAKKKDDARADSLKETIARIETEKGEDAKFDPDYEEAKNELRALNKHDKESSSFSDQSGQIQGLAAGQLTNFEATATSFKQKQDDCRRLRTQTTVQTSTQAMTTLKALELATASEKLGVTDEILSDIGKTSSAALQGIFNNVTSTLDVQNSRQLKAIKDALTASMEIDAFADEIREKVKDADLGRRALNQAHSELEEQSDKLSGITSEATREVAADEDLDEKVMKTAEDAFNASAPDTQDD